MMSTYCYNINTPDHYNLKMTCHIHGWVNLAPFSWDVAEQQLHFAMLVEDDRLEITVEIKIKQTQLSHLSVTISSLAKLTIRQKEIIHQGIVRALDLTTNTNELFVLSKSINKKYAALVKKGAGRLLRAPSLWEDAAKTLFTTNCTWSLSQQMSNAACSAKFISTAVLDLFPFPSAKKVARMSESSIKEKMRVGYRANYIKKLASQLSKNKIPLIERLTENELRSFFLNLQGFGPYATNHMMILSGYYDQIPFDTVVKSYLQRFHQNDDLHDFIETHYGKWGNYKWWGFKLEAMNNNSNGLGD